MPLDEGMERPTNVFRNRANSTNSFKLDREVVDEGSSDESVDFDDYAKEIHASFRGSIEEESDFSSEIDDDRLDVDPLAGHETRETAGGGEVVERRTENDHPVGSPGEEGVVPQEKTAIDRILDHLQEVDLAFGFEGDEAIVPNKQPEPPVDRFEADRYDGDGWRGGLSPRDETAETPPLFDFARDVPNLGGTGEHLDDVMEFLIDQHEDIAATKLDDKALGETRKNMPKIFSALSSALGKFARLFQGKEARLEYRLKKFGEKVDAYHSGGDRPSWSGSRKGLDRVDRLLAGGPSSLDITQPGALGVFKGDFRGEIGIDDGQRSAKLVELSNHLTTMISTLETDAADPKKNIAKLPVKDYVECGIARMIGSSTVADLRGIDKDSLLELKAAFDDGGQTNKSNFVDSMIRMLDSVAPNRGSIEEVATRRTALLERAEGAVLDGVGSRFALGRPKVPSKDDQFKEKQTLGKILGGSNVQISNNLGKLLADFRRDAADPQKNLFEMSDVRYRQAQVVEIFKRSEAGDLRNLTPERVRDLTAFFLDRGQTEKAQFMSEIGDILALSSTTDGAVELYERAALKTLAEHKEIETFLRQTSMEGTAGIKKIIDTLDVEPYQQAFKQIIERFAERPDVRLMGEQLDRDDVMSMASEKVDLGRAVNIGELAKELFAEVLKIPVPEDVKAKLGVYAEVLASRTGDTAGFINKLFADQIFLKLVSPALTDTYNTNPALRLAANVIQVVANGIEDQVKWKQPAREVYKLVQGGIRAQMNDYLVANGMPETARQG